MASTAKRRTKGSKASDGKRKRKNSGTDEDGPAFLSSKYAERPTSKIYNSRFNHTQPAELFRKDLISAMKIPDSEPLTSDDYWLIEDSWKPEWERGVQVPVFPEALPHPEIRVTRKRRKDRHFKLPKKLIRFTRDSFYNPEVHIMSYANMLDEEICRYDMDDIDFQWLQSVNQDREDFGLQPLEEAFVELVIQEFEVQAYVNFQEVIKSEEGLGVEYDEDAICDVCRSPDSLESNEMVFCDACNICVHQFCYGITKIPEGSWICQTCALGIRPPCVLCPNRGGAMKTIRTGQKWAHVGCAVWIPEVSFLNFIKMEPIIKISQVPASRWSLVCILCNEKKGACITCSEKGCKAAFHVTCAFNEGLQMCATVKNATGDDDEEYKAFCQKHSRKKFSIFSDSEEDNASLLNKDGLTSDERANLRQQKIQEKEAEFYNYVNLEEVSEKFQCDKPEIETIFYYWKLKRKSNWNRQLLTPKIDTENNCPEENSPISFLKKMVQHRQGLERARNLCYMVSKREKQARNWIDIKEKIFLKQLQLLKKEGKTLSPVEKEAVLNANFGDISYDKKFSGLNGPSPNMVSVVTNLVGEEMLKTPINGLVKDHSAKKSDRKKPERTPNPYAKHYLNGLAKRSQRWFPVKDKQSKSSRSSFDESTSHQSSNSNNHIIHKASDIRAPDSHTLSQDSDIQNIADRSTSCTGDSEPSETKENFSASLADDVSKDTQDSSSGNVYDVNLEDAYDVKVEDVYSVDVSEVYDEMSDYSISDVYSFLEQENDSCVENSCNVTNLIDPTTVNSDSENCDSLFTVKVRPHLKVFDNFNEKPKNEKSKPQNILNKCKKEKMTSKKLNFENSIVGGFMSDIKRENVKDPSDDNIVLASFKILPDKNNKNKSSHKFNTKLAKVKSKHEDSSDSDSSTIKVNDKSIRIKNILDSSRLKVSLNRNLSQQLEQNHVKLAQPIIIKTEDIVKSENNKNSISNSKTNKLAKISHKTSKKISCNLKKSSDSNCSRKLSDGSISKSEFKFGVVPSKSSPVRTQSPTHLKLGENTKFKSSPKHNAHSKVDISLKSPSSKKNSISQNSGFSSKSPSSPSAKSQEKTLSDNIDSKEKLDNVESKGSKEKISESVIIPNFKGYKIPKKPRLDKIEQNTSEIKRDNSPLSPLTKQASPNNLNNYKTIAPANNINNYKMPAPPHNLNTYNPPAPATNNCNVPPTNLNYNTPANNCNAPPPPNNLNYNNNGSWRKLEPRCKNPLPPPPPCDTWSTINGDMHHVPDGRVVMKFKRDTSDPSEWVNESYNRGWMEDFMGPPPPHLHPQFPPPYPPHSPWAPMRGRGGFAQTHRNFRHRPYT